VATDPTVYFPGRDQRVILHQVVERFPFPIAVTYSRLQDELDRQEPVAAAWQVRDAFEAFLRFTACLAVADALQAGIKSELTSAIAALVLKPQGLSLGDWHSLLEMPLEPLAALARSGRLDEGRRLLPGLLELAFDPRTGKRSALNRRIDGDDHSFVHWRNSVFGHGVFKQDRRWYAGFLEYLGGHDREHVDWDQTRALAGRLPAQFEWVRQEPYNPDLIVEGVRVVFRDFEIDFVRPDYLLDAIWQVVESRPRGYIHLSGPEGVGKAYVVRGLEREGRKRPVPVPVLAHYVQPGQSGDYQTLIVELRERAREQVKNCQQPDLQVKNDSPEVMQNEFADYLRPLMRANRLDNLVVVIDALDELPEPARNTPAITDLLPAPDRLPDGCFLVLTSRDPLRPRTRADVERLRRAGGQGFLSLRIDPAADSNRDTLRSYLLDDDHLPPERRHLPPTLRTASIADAIIDRAGGAFLYVYHLSRALGSGAFAAVDALPEGNRFYPDYLARLRSRVGAALYDEVYLPALLMLTAAYQPVTLRRLHRWGIPRERLAFALLDLSDFLRVHRVRFWHDSLADPDAAPENRYEIAHEAFVRFAHDDPELAPRLRATHARLGLAALPAPPATWHDLDPTDDAQLYDLRNALPHLVDAQQDEAADAVRSDMNYASACWSAGYVAQELARFQIAADLHDRAVNVHRALVEAGRDELANELASTLMNRGVALDSLGRVAEAVGAYDEAIRIRRAMVEAGRDELANDLAAALMNRGNALQRLGRLAEAVGAHDEAIRIRRALVEAGRGELANDLALALMNRGVALRGLGQLAKAVGAYDEAIRILRALVEAGRDELANDLALALVNRGNALQGLGRLAEAVGAHDEAIRIRRAMVEAGRDELANDLAAALMNRGNALQRLGRLAEAVGAHDEAIRILRALVEAGRDELANDLAGALMNRGNALQGLGRLAEAVGAYDEAIRILRALVEAGRDELANDLARALMNKARLLKKQEQWDGALSCFDEAVEWRERCVRAGMKHLLGDLLKVIRYGMMTRLDLGRTKEAAADVVRLLDHAAPALQSGETPGAVVKEFEELVQLLRGLSEEKRGQLEAELGPWKEQVREWIKEVDGDRA
jgi:tetratricopeptide (TPR) repeat protein